MPKRLGGGGGAGPAHDPLAQAEVAASLQAALMSQVVQHTAWRSGKQGQRNLQIHDPRKALLIPYDQLRVQRLPSAFARGKEDEGTSRDPSP